MDNNRQIQPNIIFRLVLSKTLCKDAFQLCREEGDIFRYSHGIVALHDALDIFAGAIASQLGVSLPENKAFLMPLLIAVETHERKNNAEYSIRAMNEINQLNTLRNNIKHQGIIPNQKFAAQLIRPIGDFLKMSSKYFFELEWDSISLADQIRDNHIRAEVKDVEDLIEKASYREALEKMAVIMFKVFDEYSLKSKLGSTSPLSQTDELKKLKLAKVKFLRRDWFSDLYNRIDLVKKGIDVDMMSYFQKLTGYVGITDEDSSDYVIDPSLNWGPVNWTREISLFCYDFLIDAILKNQHPIWPVKVVELYAIYTIEALNDIPIYSYDQVIYNLKKSSERRALILSRIDKKWAMDLETVPIKIMPIESGETVSGYIKNEDKENIQFLKTELYFQDDKGEWNLNYECDGG